MRWLAPLARVLGSAALLGVLIWQLSPGDLADAFASAEPVMIALAALVMLAILVLMAGKWYMLARSRCPPVDALPLARAFFIGTLLNFVLPTGIGGDAYRVLRLRQLSDGRLTDASASVIFDRVTGYVGMAAFAALGAAFAFGGLAAGLSALAGLGALVAVAAVLAGALVATASPDATPGLLPARSDIRPLVWAALISVGTHALYMTCIALVGNAYDLDVSWWYWGVVNFVTAAAALLPISVGGLGVREGGFVALLAPLDVGAAEAASASLTVVFLIAAMSLLLLLPLELKMSRRWPRRVKAAAESTSSPHQQP